MDADYGLHLFLERGQFRAHDDLPPEYEKFIEILEENEKLKAENQMFKNMCSALLNQINNGD